MSDQVSFDDADAQTFVDTVRPGIDGLEGEVNPFGLQGELLAYVDAGYFRLSEYFIQVRSDCTYIDGVIQGMGAIPQVFTDPTTGNVFSVPTINGQADYNNLTDEQVQLVLAQTTLGTGTEAGATAPWVETLTDPVSGDRFTLSVVDGVPQYGGLTSEQRLIALEQLGGLWNGVVNHPTVRSTAATVWDWSGRANTARGFIADAALYGRGGVATFGVLNDARRAGTFFTRGTLTTQVNPFVVYESAATATSAATRVTTPVPLANSGFFGRQGARLAAASSNSRLQGAAAFARSPAAGHLLRGAGVAGGAYSSFRGVQNLVAQGHPLDALEREGAGYVADVAATSFHMSSTAFLVNPNPVFGAIMIASGVTWGVATVWDNYGDEIGGFVSDRWDDGVAGLGAMGSFAGDRVGDLGNITSAITSDPIGTAGQAASVLADGAESLVAALPLPSFW